MIYLTGKFECCVSLKKAWSTNLKDPNNREYKELTNGFTEEVNSYLIILLGFIERKNMHYEKKIRITKILQGKF